MDGGLCKATIASEKKLSGNRSFPTTSHFYIEEVGEFEAEFGCCGAYFEAHLAWICLA